MSLQDPAQRIATGAAEQERLLGRTFESPKTLFESSWRDYLFAEVWTRPGLELRARYLIAIPSAAANGGTAAQLDDYVRGALTQQLLSVAELREVAVHSAVYSGWSAGSLIDEAVTRMVAELDLPEEPYVPLRDEPWDPAVRLEQGAAEFDNVMTFGGPPPVSPYFEGGILNFVFGEMWSRPGLDQRSRRWVTLVGVADSSAVVPIETHIYGAMASGNATFEEMNEFVLQYAVHSGWPRASFVQGVVMKMCKYLSQGLFWDGSKQESDDASSK